MNFPYEPGIGPIGATLFLFFPHRPAGGTPDSRLPAGRSSKLIGT